MLTIATSINLAHAKEYSEITDDIEIRYRWYKEIVSEKGDYHPLKDIKETDTIDIKNIKYVGLGNKYSQEYCSLSPEYYLLKEKHTRVYNKVHNVSYVLIENIESDTDIKIYYENKLLSYSIISAEDGIVKIYLKKDSMPEKLLFYIDDSEYTISLYRNKTFDQGILSKNIKNQKIATPDINWINKNTTYELYATVEKYEDSDFTKFIKEKVSCAYQEKYVYKYETEREYYDNNYYSNIEGYTKDINDYKVYYKGEPIVNTIEITKEKTIEVPKIEYVYIENQTQENDSSSQIECPEKIITQIKTEVIEKEIPKVPKKIYLIIFALLTTIVLLIIKLCKKYVERSI